MARLRVWLVVALGSGLGVGWGITASVTATLVVERLGVRVHDTPA